MISISSLREMIFIQQRSSQHNSTHSSFRDTTSVMGESPSRRQTTKKKRHGNSSKCTKLDKIFIVLFSLAAASMYLFHYAISSGIKTEDEQTLSAIALSEQKKITNNKVSPACLPFHYIKYNTSDSDSDSDSSSSAADGWKDFYEETWKDKAVKRPTKIHFQHMRKAGGTSIGKYLNKVIKSNQTSFSDWKHCEGGKGCLVMNDYEDGYHKYYCNQEGSNVSQISDDDWSKYSFPWDNSGSTMYVTNIREPVARAISNYKYEKRFKRVKGLQKNSSSLIQMNPVDIMTLEDFVLKPWHHPRRKQRPQRNKLWACSSNCYARWVTGMYHPQIIYSEYDEKHYPDIRSYYYPRGGGPNNNTNNEYEQEEQEMTAYGKMLAEESLKLLLRYDLIIVLEWLQNDPEYVKTIEDVFFGGVRGIGKKRNAPFDKQMKRFNELYPLNISNETLKILHQTNTIDNKLYKTLTSCG